MKLSEEFEDEIKKIARRYVSPALTKREYFAAMAMQGLCADPITRKLSGPHAKAVAADAIEIADALIAELEKTA